MKGVRAREYFLWPTVCRYVAQGKENGESSKEAEENSVVMEKKMETTFSCTNLGFRALEFRDNEAFKKGLQMLWGFEARSS